jgi:hypothetical protein
MLWSFKRRSKMEALRSPRYRHRFKEHVRVILLTEEESTPVNLVDQLLQHPLQVAGFKPFTRDEMYERSWHRVGNLCCGHKYLALCVRRRG